MDANNTSKQLLNIFDLLLAHFGPRHWWPAESTLEVVFGCILTQNVAWKNVEQAIYNLKEKNLIDIEKILNVPNMELAELIKTTRYYNQKASNLKSFCNSIFKEFNNNLENLFNLELKELRSLLLSLKGIGNETADSIILYAANKPIFVVDSYTKRIFSRIGFFKSDITYEDTQKYFMSNLQSNTYLFNEYHALIDGLGHYICKLKKPDCKLCPVNVICSKNI